MKWLRDNIGWVSAVAGVVAAGVTLYVTAAMADTRAQVAVLNERADQADRSISELGRKTEDTNQKVNDVWKWLAEDRRQRSR